MENRPISAIAVVGPTASGKTSLAIALSRRFGGEIISSDSMQIYRHMDIGTAKASPEEQQAVTHHLLDILEPNEPYSAADYGEDAYRIACSMNERGILPVFCGGTGLYLNAACRPLHENAPPSDPALRARLAAEAESEEGREMLWQRLLAYDPEEAAKTHCHNVRRVIRALEICILTGRPKSLLDREATLLPPRIRLLPLLLNFSDRQLLYARIDERVDLMMEHGLAEETRRLLAKGVLAPETTAGQAIGYKELIPWLEGRASREEALEELKTATRRYAKRQLTWFRAMEGIVTLTPDRPDGTLKTPEELADEAAPTIRDFLSEQP